MTTLWNTGRIWGFPKIRGTLFWGLNNKDYSISGSILGSPYFGKLPYDVLVLIRTQRLPNQQGSDGHSSTENIL